MAQALLSSSNGVMPRGTQSFSSLFTQGSLHVFNAKGIRRRKVCSSIRCESTKESQSGADTWLGRLAMVGFASGVLVEVSTGKGLLENFGLATPQPTLALFVSALVIGLTVFFIFQSASKD